MIHCAPVGIHGIYAYSRMPDCKFGKRIEAPACLFALLPCEKSKLSSMKGVLLG